MLSAINSLYSASENSAISFLGNVFKAFNVIKRSFIFPSDLVGDSFNKLKNCFPNASDFSSALNYDFITNG